MAKIVFHSKSANFVFSTSRLYSTRPGFSDESYQYLERSIVPSMHFQKSLPRLPVPKLEKTLERYLAAVKPIFTDDQYATAQRLTNEFGSGVAKKLHDELVNRNKMNKDSSFITEPWFDMYLKARVPLPINYNPFMAWVHDPDPKYNDQLVRATNLVVSACRFKRSLDAGVLSPEVYHLNPEKSDTKSYRQVMKLFPPSLSWYGSYLLYKAFPLDMSQYPSLFNSTRIPVVGKDQLRRYPNSRHLLVLRKGHFFTVDVLEQDGTIKAPSEIMASLSHILSLDLEKEKRSIGVLTTMERDKWAAARTQLIQEGNEQALATVDSALFVLCLDDTKSAKPVEISKNLLHSDGVNRWFDKSFSIIVQANGLSAVNFEHSWGDGVAVMRLMEDLHKDTCKNHWVGPDTKPSNVDVNRSVRKIEFKLSPGIQGTLNDAGSTYSSWCNRLQFATLEYTRMTREFVKKQSLSPDAVMQAAIQVAFYRQYRKYVPTYESCSTAAFKRGRTETVRSATSDTKRFTDALVSGKDRPANSELRQMLESCSKTHSRLVKEAAMGQGFDRHLFAMKHLCENGGGPTPEFYSDNTYQYSNHYVLSTSTLSTDTVLVGGFGPVVPDGYGIGYNVGEKRLGCVISAYADTRNASEFADCLETSLDDIHNILKASSPR